MKKLFILFAFFGCLSFSATAQKACCASKSAKTATCSKTAAANKTAAATLASADASIETKVCSKSGNVSYVKNSVCPTTGKATSVAVKYDEKSQKFVNVSPTSKQQAVGGKNVKTAKTVKAVKTVATKKKCDPKSCKPSQCKKSAKVEN